MALPSDPAVREITQRSRESLTFEWFRGRFRADHNAKESLIYGHAVIDQVALLDQYLHSYGPMIKSQWTYVSSYLDGLVGPSRWIDYGCGQGLAGLLINDLTRGALLDSAREMVLIEPSALALRRAVAVYRTMAPRGTVIAVAKRFDDLEDGDLPGARSEHTVHVFSNTLDVLGFDAVRLLKSALGQGRHTILAVSHHRSFNGGTPRIEAIKAAVEQFAAADGRAILRSEINRFTCDNPSHSEGVIWFSELEINDG